MKKSIIYLGIALVSLSNVCNASNGFSNERNILDQDFQEKSLSIENKNSAPKNYPAIVAESTFNPEIIIPMKSENKMEQTIAENNSIIESKIIYNNDLFYIEKSVEDVILADNQLIESEINNQSEPIYIEKSIEEIIYSNNQLIESNISNEVFVLDFEKLNNKTNTLKKINNKKIIGMN